MDRSKLYIPLIPSLYVILSETKKCDLITNEPDLKKDFDFSDITILTFWLLACYRLKLSNLSKKVFRTLVTF